MGKSTYKRSSKKTGNNSRRTTTLNSKSNSRTISNSRGYASGSRKTISHNSKTGRTRTTYTIRNGGGWITRFTTMSGSSSSKRKGRSRKHSGSERTSRNDNYYVGNMGDGTWSGIFKNMMIIALYYIAMFVGALLLLYLAVWILF